MQFITLINKIVTVLKIYMIVVYIFKNLNTFEKFIDTVKGLFFDIYKKNEKIQHSEVKKKIQNNKPFNPVDNVIENRLNNIIMLSKNIAAHNGLIYTSCVNYPCINDDKTVGMVFDLNTKLWIGNWSYKENYKGEHINKKYIKSVNKDFDNEIYVDRYLNIVFNTFVNECIVEDSEGYICDDDIEDAFVKWFDIQRIKGYNPSISEVFYYFINRYGVSFSKTIIPGIKLNTSAILENEKRMLDEYDPEEDYELWGLWY